MCELIINEQIEAQGWYSKGQLVNPNNEKLMTLLDLKISRSKDGIQ